MTVEIGEALLYSWLKHVLGYHVVQTNWKASQSWEISGKEKLLLLVKAAANEKIIPNKRNSKPETLAKRILKQFECDCVGMKLTKKGVEVVGAEVAIHTAGLHYTPSKTSEYSDSGKYTAHKIVQKLFIAAVAFWGYLGVKTARLYFVTPKIAPALSKDIEASVARLRDFWNRETKDLGYSFEVLHDGGFYKQILRPVCDKAESISDASELFVRCVQIERLLDEDCDVDEENDAEYCSYEDSHKRNLLKATELLKRINPQIANPRSLRRLYEACVALKKSKKDQGGWMRMAMREEFRRKKDLPDRPTLWTMRRRFEKDDVVL